MTNTADLQGTVAQPMPPATPAHTHTLSGTKTLLLGAPGSGKTYSIPTLVEAGLETFVLITDPGGEESLIDSMERRKLDLAKLHWRYIAPASPDWGVLQDMAKKINMMGYNDLTGLKSGVGKQGYDQFLQVLNTLANFKCDHCGREFGSVTSWGPDRAFVMDSLSGINIMAMDMMIGAKPAAHQGEWGVAMNAEERLVAKLTADTKCFFVLTGHLEREMDEVAGNVQLMAAALGRKLAPKLPRTFSDVIMAYREGDRFFWSTSSSGVDLKSRTLPLRDKLDPSFVQIVERWKERSKRVNS